jgi:predicted ATPase/transcriptional regulator with XRE-family HTH domain/Tfp pilus assembly protein PilF
MGSTEREDVLSAIHEEPAPSGYSGQALSGAKGRRAEVAFGPWIREARKALDLTQAALAAQVGCSVVTIQKIEQGVLRPSAQIAELLAVTLEVEPGDRQAFVRWARLGSSSGKATGSAPSNRGGGYVGYAKASLPTNLPVPTTSFIGREREVTGVSKLLRSPQARLLTLTGPGGVGKTRLALQVGAETLTYFPDGVWFVDLSPILEAALVTSTIAQALGIKEAPGKPLIETLVASLGEKQILLVLDNFEQVEEAAGQVSRLLAGCPRLKVLVTSRVPLRLRGEKEYSVPPMEVPSTEYRVPGDSGLLAANPAVRLFAERAADIKRDFQLTEDNAQAVAEICVRLDGLPLAIELAAARMRLFSPQALLGRLSESLKVLTSGTRDSADRQKTLRKAIDWSFNLLDEGEKQLFRRVAVFSGGRTAAALEAVCNSDGGLELDVLDGVESLVEKNLLRPREASHQSARDAEPRFWMLETIHEYAREKLAESGEDAQLRRRHLSYFMELAEEAEPHLTGARQAEWLGLLEDDYDNIRAALRWSRENGDAEAGLRIVAAIWRYWYILGNFSEGRELLEGALSNYELRIRVPSGRYEFGSGAELGERGEGASIQNRGLVAKAFYGAGALAYSQGDYTAAYSTWQEALAISRQVGDKKSIADALNGLGNVAVDQADYASARSFYDESLALRRELGEKWGVALSLSNLGNIAYDQGDHPTARSLYEESLAIQRELGDKRGVALSLNGLGIVAEGEGDYAAARSLYEESMSIYRELGDKRGIAYVIGNLGTVADRQGDYTSARALYEEGLAIQRELGDKAGVAQSLDALGYLAYREGDTEQARDLYTQSLIINRELGNKLWIAQCLIGLGGVAGMGSLGQVERGAKLLGAGEEILEAIGAALEPLAQAERDRSVETARSRLGEEAFAKTWAEGRAMSLEQAMNYALEGYRLN